jgi:hypothetical protein
MAALTTRKGAITSLCCRRGMLPSGLSLDRHTDRREGAYIAHKQPWYHMDMSKSEAEFLLNAARKDGSVGVRLLWSRFIEPTGAFVVCKQSKGYMLHLYFGDSVLQLLVCVPPHSV